MEHWIALLEQLQLIGQRTGLGIMDAKLIFMWSKVADAPMFCYFCP